MSQPLSYEEVIDHILHNKEVPGVEDVPDVVLEEPIDQQSSAPRLKPWQVSGHNTESQGSGADVKTDMEKELKKAQEQGLNMDIEWIIIEVDY